MSRGLNLGSYITISVVAFVFSKILFAFLLYWRWSRRRRVCEDTMSGGKMVMFKSSSKDCFTSENLLKKTLNLTSKDIIGTGGYGTVYKLVLDEHTAFAVKRLTRGSTDRDRGFERELEAMGDIKHRNIVTLRGYCSTQHVNLLVYDLMHNGSLETILHERSPNKKPLDWPARHKIALGAARGIAYLHHDCIPHIIHRDIKSSNILLDKDMEARISDFGLATLINPHETHVSTFVAGTFGYLAPEYVDTGRATEKGDIYSYGVVLLELLTGKRPTDEAFVENGNNLVIWVKALLENDCEEHAFDVGLANSSTLKEMKETLIVANKCLNKNPYERPSMAQLVKMLEQIKLDVDFHDRDKLQLKATNDGSASYAALEKKAELYAKLMRGELPDEEEKEKYCVDFLRKGALEDEFEQLEGNSKDGAPDNNRVHEANMLSSDSDGRRAGIGWTGHAGVGNEHKRLVREVNEETTEARGKASLLKQRRQIQAEKNREKLRQAFLKKQIEKLKAAKTEDQMQPSGSCPDGQSAIGDVNDDATGAD